MIRGVNRRIVEITSTENDYFEKAVLYIRPEKTSYPQSQLDYEAKVYLSSIAPQKNNSAKGSMSFLSKLVALSGIILFLTVLVYTLYYFIL